MKKTALDFTKQPARLSLLDSGAHRPDLSRLSIEFIERHSLDWLAEAEYLQQSPNTITGKKDVIAKLIWWMQTYEVPACGHKEFRRFLAYIGNGHLQPGGRWGNPKLTEAASSRTIQYYFIYLRGFCRWLTDEEIIDENPMAALPSPKVEQDQIQPFSMEQIEALLHAARQSPHPKRDEAILLFMLDTGVRASELCSLQFKNLELNGSYGTATVLGKGKKKRTVPFSRRAARSLWQYLRESPRQTDSPVFLSDRGILTGAGLTRSGLLQLFERLGRMANIQNVRCSPHTMRHTFAISYLRAGGNTFTLQTMLGHSALHQTQRYVAVAQADVAAQHRQFSPADHLDKKR